MVDEMYEATPAELRAAAGRCSTTYDTVVGEIAAMKNYVLGLMAINRGPSATEFQVICAQWDRGAINLNSVLSDIATGLITNANNYDQDQAEGVANIRRVQGAMPPLRM